MCSLLSDADARASRENRATIVGSDAISAAKNFSATCVPSVRCVASTTKPIPPRPMMRSTRYLSATTVPGCIRRSYHSDVEIADLGGILGDQLEPGGDVLAHQV